MFHFLSCLFRDDSGATATEYGLVAALISLSIVTGATYVGQQLDSTFGNIATSLSNLAL